MNNIYFIANNLKLRKGIFEELKQEIYKGDVLHFNFLFHFDKFKNHPRNIIYHNINAKDGKLSWWGIENFDKYMKVGVKDRYLYYNSYIQQYYPDQYSYLKNWENTGGKIMYHSNDEIKNYPTSTNQVASAGFMCYKYFKPLYDKIYLIGFTFEGSPKHNWEYEKCIILSDPSIENIK